MLTILRDPDGITGRERHPWDCSVSMQANVERYLSAGGDYIVTLNGERIDPATDPRLDAPPSVFDELSVVHRPGEIGLGTALFLGALLAGVAVYASMPKVIPPQQGDAVGKESSNNRLTAQTNLARAYQAIPDVYGYRRVWPDLIQPSSVEYIDNVKWVTEWLCVSRGRGTITDVRYSETPLADIEGARWYGYYPPTTPEDMPELNSTTIPNVIETFPTDDVNGQEIAFAATSVPTIDYREATFTALGPSNFSLAMDDGSVFEDLKFIAGSGTAFIEFIGNDANFAAWLGLNGTFNVDSFSVSSGVVTFQFSGAITGWPSGPDSVMAKITPSGGTGATIVGPFTLPVDSQGIRWNIVFLRGLKGSAEIRAEWWQIDGGGVEVSGSRQTLDETFTGDTYDQRFFTRTVWPTAGLGRYRIQFERLNTESTDGTDVAKLEEVYAVRKYATKTLPGVTVVKVITKATTAATGFADRKINLRWQRSVRTLTSETISPSRNFARAMAHVWTLAGEDIAELDTAALQAINDDLGETSPLLRFDGTLDDSDMSLGERMQRIAYHVRGVVWRDGTKWTVTREQAKPALVPEVQFDYRNLAADGDSTIAYSAHLPASYDGVEVEFVHEASQLKKDWIRLSIASGSVVSGTSSRPLKINLSGGCATIEQATNRAHLEARRLLYQRTSVTDTALDDAAQLGLGSLCRWVDPNDFYADDDLQAGEVVAIDGTTVTLSEEVDFKSETSGRIVFTGTDGQPVGSPVVCTPGASATEVIVASVPAGVYLANGTTQQASSRYTFAVGVSDAELEAAGLYVLTSIAPASDRTHSIVLANYDERLFEED